MNKKLKRRKKDILKKYKKIKNNKYVNYSIFFILVSCLFLVVASVIASLFGMYQIFDEIRRNGIITIQEYRFPIMVSEYYVYILSIVFFIIFSAYILYRIVKYSLRDDVYKNKKKMV